MKVFFLCLFLVLLSVERAKSKDLNQTISEILEEMEDIKKNFIRNEEKIKTNSENFIRNEEKITKNSANIATLATRGIWCGYSKHWNTTGTIVYDTTPKADTNMEITVSPLDKSKGD